jgi:hypothetical protein
MKKSVRYLMICLLPLSVSIICSCTKNQDVSEPYGMLKRIIHNGYVSDEFTYNHDNLIDEVNSTQFYRKFYYDSANKLTKEEIAMNPDMLSSSMPSSMSHDFVNPTETGITMYLLYKYSINGNLTRQLSYVSVNGKFEFRSMRTFEYNDNNMVSKILLHDSDSTVTQFITFQHDNNGNVSEQDGYSYLFIPSGSEPIHLYKANFEYDAFQNPFKIFSQTINPGIYTNTNNIIKTINKSFLEIGNQDQSVSEYTYEYDLDLAYPVRSSEGVEYFYNK